MNSLVRILEICPVAPGAAAHYVDRIAGNVVWGVLWLFPIGIVLGVAAMIAGRIFGMPHVSKAGVITLVVVFLSAIAYLSLPGMLDALMGKGCI